MALTMRPAFLTAMLPLVAIISAQSVSPTVTAAPTTTPSITAVSGCHPHATVYYCMAGKEEYQIVGPTATEQLQPQYTGCQAHEGKTYCLDDAGKDVEVLVEPSKATNEQEQGHDDHGHSHSHSEGTAEEPAGSEEHCHFHAGVEHCVGGSSSSSETASADGRSCAATPRSYNIPLRIGLLFVIMVTSAFGVFLPILTTRFNVVSRDNIFFVVLKQFGTGIVLSTAFIHLFTHAQLMFGNSCLGELEFEGTTAAIFMAGLFLSFLADYLGARFVQWRTSKRASPDAEVRTTENGSDKAASTSTGADREPTAGNHCHVAMVAPNPTEEKINVINLEAGIIFHSILIGITLVVAGDTFFITLFVVILFHQMFEGMALGTCIAELPKAAASTLQQCIMGALFAVITPIGMAIGIGVLNQFNGNDPSTIIAIGTLDALSAGILAWVGIVEMLARDWLHGRLLNAGLIRTLSAMFALICGMILMSVLGKWA